MSDQLFIVLRVCLLALVYLVFLRVLRAVWVELRAEGARPAPAPAPRRSKRAPAPAPVPEPVGAPLPASAPTALLATGRLAIVAPAGLAGQTFVVDGETTIGRGAGCAVSIDDAHVSKLHARISPADGGWMIEDLGSTNGTVLDGSPLRAPVRLMPGSRISIGEIVLEFT
ncbi:MAG: FHA domain-containing protein [Acidimicrobiales bacterium]|nr:FHA domain-containing protein [Acidimicrobiales bacterium]